MIRRQGTLDHRPPVALGDSALALNSLTFRRRRTMTRLVSISLITILAAFGLWASSPASPGNAAPPPADASFEEVFQAHGGPSVIMSVTGFQAEVVRLTTTLPTQFIERRLIVSVDHERFRRHSTDPLGLRRQVELFDGQGGFKAISTLSDEAGKVANEFVAMDNDRLRDVTFSIRTCGLLPFLQTFARAAQKPVYEEYTKDLLHRFRFESSAGPWLVSTDLAHRVRRVEMGDKTYDFAGYRSINGLELPMIQRMSVGNQLIYELVFSDIELNPAFPQSQFSREGVVQDLAR